MIGLRALRENFLNNQAEWKMVAQKGLLYLKKQLAPLKEQQINDLINKVNFELVE